MVHTLNLEKQFDMLAIPVGKPIHQLGLNSMISYICSSMNSQTICHHYFHLGFLSPKA
jgi:hypothetical protein